MSDRHICGHEDCLGMLHTRPKTDITLTSLAPVGEGWCVCEWVCLCVCVCVGEVVKMGVLGCGCDCVYQVKIVRLRLCEGERMHVVKVWMCKCGEVGVMHPHTLKPWYPQTLTP